MAWSKLAVIKTLRQAFCEPLAGMVGWVTVGLARQQLSLLQPADAPPEHSLSALQPQHKPRLEPSQGPLFAQQESGAGHWSLAGSQQQRQSALLLSKHL